MIKPEHQLGKLSSTCSCESNQHMIKSWLSTLPTVGPSNTSLFTNFVINKNIYNKNISLQVSKYGFFGKAPCK